MVLLQAFMLASKEIFDYNRENYKFDQEQRLERDLQRVEMQIQRFDLFREDIEDLVKLTVDKMDMYHVVGALFLAFTALIFCEGIVGGPQPHFFLAQYLLTTASSFIFLLMAVWLSMYASIASHSFGVRLRTRYVRLPIPNLQQIQSLTTKLADFEKQGVSKVMRLPFGPHRDQKWQLEAEREGGASSSAGPKEVFGAEGHTALPETTLGGASDVGFGNEATIMRASASLPGKHVELFRKLQAKWQCYDAYARISMALGVNQLIQSVNYFVVGVCMITCSMPSCGLAATLIFQFSTFGLMFLDIAGLKSWNIFVLQSLGSLPMLLTVAMLIAANLGRAPEETLLETGRVYYASPLCPLLQAVWLQVFMWVAHPSNDEASLPRRFRAVLFLDVFSDVSDPTDAEHAAVTAGDGMSEDPEAKLRALQQTQAAVCESSFVTAQSALRRWEAIPQELLTNEQHVTLEHLRQEIHPVLLLPRQAVLCRHPSPRQLLLWRKGPRRFAAFAWRKMANS